MRIRLTDDGRMLQGTATQIVQTMRSLALGRETVPLGEYVDWVADQLSRLKEVSLDVGGETGDVKAQKLVAEILRTGLAEML